MEEYIETQPKYTMRWLGIHIPQAMGAATILSLIAALIAGLAEIRVQSGLMHQDDCSMVSDSICYCFPLIAITLLSLMLVEIAFRREINYVQYILVGLALTLFYLLLIAMAEKMPFWVSYTIVTAMTVGLIATFIKGIVGNPKAVGLTTAILVVEYSLVFLLIQLGSMALLVGSLSLFLLIAVAMYFTLKLRIENQEITLK